MDWKEMYERAESKRKLEKQQYEMELKRTTEERNISLTMRDLEHRFGANLTDEGKELIRRSLKHDGEKNYIYALTMEGEPPVEAGDSTIVGNWFRNHRELSGIAFADLNPGYLAEKQAEACKEMGLPAGFAQLQGGEAVEAVRTMLANNADQ